MLQNFNICNASTLYFNLQTKFEMSSFVRSKDMAWAPKCRNESCDLDHTYLGDNQDQKANTSLRPSGIQDLTSPAVAIAEIFQGCNILKLSRNPDHTQLGDSQASRS